jgi:hypothetical protein
MSGAEVRSRPARERRDDREAASAHHKNALAKAIRYVLSLWKGLSRNITNGLLEMSNNAAERGKKPPVLRRKNYLFCGERRMTKDRAAAGRATARLDALGVGSNFHGSAIVNSGSRDQESNVVVNALDVCALDDQVIQIEQIHPYRGIRASCAAQGARKAPLSTAGYQWAFRPKAGPAHSRPVLRDSFPHRIASSAG